MLRGLVVVHVAFLVFAGVIAACYSGTAWRSSVEDPRRWLRRLDWDARVIDQADGGHRFGRPLPRRATADGRPAAAWLVDARAVVETKEASR